MSKASPAVEEKQENPLVRIVYDPANAPIILSANGMKALARIQGIKCIETVRQMEAASQVISETQVTAEEIERFCDTLREAVQEAAAKFRVIPGMEDFAANLTITRWSLRQLIKDGLAERKTWRGNYLAAEEEKTRREQLRLQAEQDRINKEAADKDAAAAKKAGAGPQAVADIRENVLQTPAPIVTSKAAEAAQNVGASVRYGYSAKITDLKKFLLVCLQNESMFNTLKSAIPDIEAAFRTTAAAQKESFNYPGITFVKKPIDVGRRS